MKQLALLLAALFIAATGISQTGFTEDFETDPGWPTTNEYIVSHQGTMEYIQVKKFTKWRGLKIDLGGSIDISSMPILNLDVLSEKPIKLFVYLVDADDKNSQRPQRILNFGEFVNVCYDFIGDATVDLTRITHIIFAVNGDATSFSGDLWFDNLKLGTDAELTANLMANLGGLGKITHHSGAGSGSFLITDIENSTGLTVTGAEDLIQNVIVSAIEPYDHGNSGIIEAPNSNGNVVVTYDLVPGGTGSSTVSITALGDAAYADNTISFDIEIEGDQVPTIDQVGDIEAGVGVYTEVMLTGISDGNSVVNQDLTLTAISDDLAVISDIIIDYEQGEYAVLSFTALTAKMGVGITVRVQDDGALNNSTEMVFHADVYDDYNNSPTIDRPVAQSLLNGDGEQSILLTGISDGDAGSQNLTLTAVSSDEGVVISGDITIIYTQGDSSAQFVFSPAGEGTTTITITVADDGGNGSNNGDALTGVDFDIEVRAVAPTGHQVPMSEFDTTGMGTSERLEVLSWSIDGNLASQSGTLGTFHGKDNVIKLDLSEKSCWGGLWYKCPEINVDKNRYLSYDIYFEGSDFSDGGQTHTYFWDDGWDNNLSRNVNGAHNLRQTVTEGSWHTIVMDYSLPGGMDNKNGEEINGERIQKILLNYASNFTWPFPSDNGSVYVANIKIGSDVPEELLPEVTPECTINPVADRVHTEVPGVQEILLTGIGAGDDGTVTPDVSVVSNNTSFISPVSGDLENGTMLLTYEPAAGIESAIITLTVSATGLSNTEISFEIATVTAVAGSAANVSIDLSQEFQTIRGFGTMAPPEHLVNLYVNDIGATVARIGTGKMIEPVNDNNDPYVLNRDGLNYDAYDWDYYKMLKASGIKSFILSIWTPPSWMKDNLSTNYFGPAAPSWGSTDNKLSRYYYDEFAETCVAYVKMFREEAGIELDALSLQNEPSFCEPYGSSIIDAAHWPELINKVTGRFQEEGISTKIFALEEVQPGPIHGGIDAIQADPTANQTTEIIAIHGYQADGITPEFPDFSKWESIRDNCQEGDYPKELWMSETSFFETDWEYAMLYGAGIYGGLEYGDVSQWVWYSFTKAYIENGNQPSNIYAAAKQFYKFIEPGAQRVKTVQSEDPHIMVTSFRNTDDTLAIVIINKSLEPRSLHVNITNGDAPAGFIVYQSIPYQICQQTASVVYGETVALPAMSFTTLQAIPVENFTLTVDSGSGAGRYPEGSIVAIEADTPPEGEVFESWTGDVDGITDVMSATTTLTMPASDIAVTASYETLIDVAAIEGQDMMAIYPNPAGESVFILLPETEYNTLMITNILGEKLLIMDITPSMDRVTLDLSSFVPGVYIVSLQSEEKFVKGSLVIK